MLLISFAGCNTAQLLTDLTFSPHFLTYKIKFSMLVSRFFPFLVGPFAWSSYPFLAGLSPAGSGVLNEFFLLHKMQKQLYIFDFRNLLCSQVSKFRHSSEIKKKPSTGRQKSTEFLSFHSERAVICLIRAIFYSHLFDNILAVFELALPPESS